MSRSTIYEDLARARASVTSEEAITACLKRLRMKHRCIDDTPTGEYHQRWAKALPDERPIIVVSVLGERSVGTWVMDPYVDESVYIAADYSRITDGVVTLDRLGYLETKIRELISWLWAETERADRLDEFGAEWLPPEQRED